jgi:hypothetical protein
VVSGIKKDLFFDFSLHGGVLHSSPRGGKLGVHLDRQIHKKIPTWKRELTVIVYLNKYWDEGWGGNLELWGDPDFSTRTLRKRYKSISPMFNRMILFQNTENSFHGFPQQIECPEHESRKAMVFYYYSAISIDETLTKGGRYFLTQSDEMTPEMMDYIRRRSGGHDEV